ncbi:MAG: LacI family DNA-binding transcriptional regulator [Gammaproteobacteria bacterium]|nr:LacI family DNA-binding transcriptional regulator [Gammaproteobacteria bacterium]
MRSDRKFSIKQIAAQAGMGKATVDRVIHQRGQVSYQSEQRIKMAIVELQEQQNAVILSGRTFYIDVLMHAPDRFCHAIRAAVNQQILEMSPFRIRPRFHLFEQTDVQSMRQQLLKIAQTDSHGVILKAVNDPLLAETINALNAAKIPVVTLVTDLPNSRRLSYVGMDNERAGDLAAYLFKQWLNHEVEGKLLVVMSNESFSGEADRVSAFKQSLAQYCPKLDIVLSQGSDGVDAPMYRKISNLIATTANIKGVYSVGGANTAIIEAFEQMDRTVEVFIGHDLDCDNRLLLAQGKIQAVIYHDLQWDINQAFRSILQYHRMLENVVMKTSKLEIVTPFNLPN